MLISFTTSLFIVKMVITPCEFIEIWEANYHLIWKSCLWVWKNDTAKSYKKSYNESKKNYKLWMLTWCMYIVHNDLKIFGECLRHHISCICFSGQIMSHWHFKRCDQKNYGYCSGSTSLWMACSVRTVQETVTVSIIRYCN